MKFLNKVSLSIQKFMYGRNGMDYCNKVLMWLYTIFLFATIFMPNLTAAYVTLGIAFVFAFIFLFRFFSKNLGKRRVENEFTYGKRDKIRKFFKLQKNKWRDRKTHKYVKCPGCKSVLRMKKDKGSRTINCPKCGTEIHVKVHAKVK